MLTNPTPKTEAICIGGIRGDDDGGDEDGVGSSKAPKEVQRSIADAHLSRR